MCKMPSIEKLPLLKRRENTILPRSFCDNHVTSSYIFIRRFTNTDTIVSWKCTIAKTIPVLTMIFWPVLSGILNIQICQIQTSIKVSISFNVNVKCAHTLPQIFYLCYAYVTSRKMKNLNRSDLQRKVMSII